MASTGDFDRDGTPDFALGKTDRIQVISGRTLTVLHTFVAPQTGVGFGAVFEFGDCNGDGWPDLIAGAPRTSTFGPESGTVWVVSGRTGQALLVLHGTTPLEHCGESIAVLGDVTLDGRVDIAVGSPGWSSGRGRARVISGLDGTVVLDVPGPPANFRFGTSLASVGDVYGDARQELGIAVGVTLTQFDRIQVWSLEANTLLYTMTTPRFVGFACIGDANADGIDDVILLPSEPSPSPAFRIRFGGGADLGVAPSDTLNAPSSAVGLGSLADYDGDGVAEEFLIGINDPYAFVPGEVRVYKGLDRIATIPDATSTFSDSFGQSIAAVGDIDGNGSVEFVVGAPTADSPLVANSQGGRAELFCAVTPEPVEYCTAKTNGLGCVPSLSHFGSASLTGAALLTISVDQVLNRRSGLCLWGPNRQELPFQGGHLCVAAPFRRGPLESSGGSAVGDDCTGRLEFEFSAPLMWLHGVSIGDLLRAQFWYRDPLHADGTGIGLSSAFEIRIGW